MAEVGCAGGETLSERIEHLAFSRPEDVAFVEGTQHLTWSSYRRWADQVRQLLVERGVSRKDRVAILLQDGPLVHAMFVAVERAGAIVVGIGPRSGPRELSHLPRTTGASVLISRAQHRDLDVGAVVRDLAPQGHQMDHLIVTAHGDTLSVRADEQELILPPESSPNGALERWLDVGDIFLINSTSGTTGLPKCVVHTQHRWRYFHELAVQAGRQLREDIRRKLAGEEP